MVIAALLPVAVVSILQGVDRASQEIADVHDRLLQTTRAASTDEENMLAAADQILRALASLSDVRDATSDCNHDLSDALQGLTFFTNIARVDAQGRIVCSAKPATIGRSMADRPAWRAVQQASNFIVTGQMSTGLAHQPAVAGILPLRTPAGQFSGALAIEIDVRWLDFMLKAKQLPQGAVVGVFDSAGNIIATNNPDIAVPVFAHAQPQFRKGQLQTASDKTGRVWSYATAALLGNATFVGFAMPEATLLQPTYIHVTTDFLLPILMIVLASGAIWITTDRQITRWIVYLRRISTAYRSGHYTVRPVLDDAPSEFQSLGGALADMAAAIQERDKSLREAVAQKTMLIREIHHRVKNNLQVVISLLNLQAQQFHDPAAQLALKQAQMRINALALVHRILYEIEDQTSVDLGLLLRDLTEQVREGMSGEHHNLRLELNMMEQRVPGEMAVPIALFTVEALTNIFKHAYPERDMSGVIRVELEPAGPNRVKLTIRDDGAGYDVDAPSVGSRLVGIFASQLGGTFQRHSEKGKGTTLELEFPLRTEHMTDA